MSEVKPIRKPPDNKEPLQRETGEAQHYRRSDFNRTADSQPHRATAAAGVGRTSGFGKNFLVLSYPRSLGRDVSIDLCGVHTETAWGKMYVPANVSIYTRGCLLPSFRRGYHKVSTLLEEDKRGAFALSLPLPRREPGKASPFILPEEKEGEKLKGFKE
jgi:hypothetical protein